MTHLLLTVGWVAVWVAIGLGTRYGIRRGSTNLETLKERTVQLERDTGLVFEQYGDIYWLWNGYWEWKQAEADKKWYVRPEGWGQNQWFLPSWGEDEIRAQLEKLTTGYQIGWDFHVGSYVTPRQSLPVNKGTAKKPPDRTDTLHNLERRVQELERENRRLKAKLTGGGFVGGGYIEEGAPYPQLIDEYTKIRRQRRHQGGKQ